MAKLSLKDFSGGLSTKLKSHAIADNEAVEAQNIDFSGFALKSSEGIDTTRKSGENVDGNGHFHHKQEWISDPTAQSFEEFGDYVIKTYSDSTPKVTKVIPGEPNTEEPLGVPQKPGSKLATAVVSEGDIGLKDCFGFPVLEVSQWGQENYFDTTGEVEFTSSGGSYGIIFKGMTGSIFTPAQGPAFKANSEVAIIGSDGNDGRYKITAISALASNPTFWVNKPWGKVGSQTNSIRIKTQGAVDSAADTLEDVDVLINDDSEDLIHYAPTLNKFTSYNKTTGRATIYDTNNSGNDNTSAELTHRGNNEKFLGDWFRTHDNDGLSVSNLANVLAPVENISLAHNDAVGLTGITRSVDSVRHFSDSMLISSKSVGTMSYTSQTVSGELWLEKGKKYLLIDIADNGAHSAGYQLYKKDATTGNRKEITPSWTNITFSLQAGHTMSRVSYTPFKYYATPVLTDHQFLTASNPTYTKVFEITGDVSYSITGTDLVWKKRDRWGEYATIRVGSGYFSWSYSTRVGWNFRDYYEVNPVLKINAGGKELNISWGPTLTRHNNSTDYWWGSSSVSHYSSAWTANGIWALRTGSMKDNASTVEHTYVGNITDAVQSRILEYTLGSSASLTRAGDHAVSKMTGKFIIQDSTHANAVDSTTITIHDSSDNVTSYDWREGFKVGDKIKITGSKWNDTTSAKIISVGAAQIQIEGKYAYEKQCIVLDTSSSYGDFHLNKEEGMTSHYGVRRTENSKEMMRAYNTSHQHQTAWGSVEIKGTNPVVYGETYSGLSYFVIKTGEGSSYSVKRVRADSTTSTLSFPIEKHNYFDVQPNRITVSGQDADIVVYNFSGNTVYSRDGAGTSLGLNASQKVNRAWFDSNTVRIIIELLDKTLLVIKPNASIKNDKSPSQSVLRAPFNHFLRYDTNGNYLFGVHRSDDGKFSNIQKTRPFYFDELVEGSRVEEQVTAPSQPSIGTVVKSLKKKDVSRFRYLLVDFIGPGCAWENPSETKKSTFRFFLPGSTTASPRYFDFESVVMRDVVVFSSSENNIPQEGSETTNDQLTFYHNYDYDNNQDISSYYYYVLKKQHLSLHSDHKLHAHQLKLGDPTTQTAYGQRINTHGIGRTNFFIGAPNMFDSLGAQLPFRYQASFVDRNGREGPPCDMTDEITGVTTPNDSIQIAMNSSFLSTARHPSGADMSDRLRIYRYGGNYSKFKWLADRDIKTVIKNGLPYSQDVKNADVLYVSNQSGDQVHAKLRTWNIQPYEDGYVNSTYGPFPSLHKFEDYAGSTIDVSGFSNTDTINGNTVSHNNGLMRIINLTTEDFASTHHVTINTIYADEAAPSQFDSTVTIQQAYFTATSNTTAYSHVFGYQGNAFPEGLIGRIKSDDGTFDGRVQVRQAVLTGGTGARVDILYLDNTLGPTQTATSANSPHTPTNGVFIPEYVIMRVQAHPNGNLLQTISGTKTSLIGYNSPALAANAVEEAGKDISIAVTEFGFRDRERHPPVTAIAPQYDANPPFVLDANGELKEDAYFQNITNVGGIFFSNHGSKIRFSHFNNPHSWPAIGYIEVDSDVTGITEYFGEGLVFTGNAVYRIRGNDPEQMSLIKIPDNQGLPVSYRKTLTVVDGTVIWISNDGICMYDSGRVRLLTLNKFGEFPVLNNPIGVAQDRIVYFLQSPNPEGGDTRLGIKMDLSYGEPKITRTTIEANHAIYVPVLDKLFVNNTVDNTKSGTIGGGDNLPVIFKSKSFDFGDINEHKALLHLEADYKALDVIKRDTYTGGVKGSEAVREYLTNTDGGNLNVAEAVIEAYQLNQAYEDNKINAELELGTVTDSISSSATTNEKLVNIDTSDLLVGMYVWGSRVAKGSKISEIVSSSQLRLDKAALTTGSDTLYFGDLPRISLYADDSETPVGVVYPFPGEGSFVSTDLYLNDYEVFRTISFKIEGVLEAREISINAEPTDVFNKHTLFHSLDMSFTGTVDLVLTVDGNDVYMDTFTAEKGIDEKRVYIPSSTFGTVPYFKNNSHEGRIADLKFNSYSMRV